MYITHVTSITSCILNSVYFTNIMLLATGITIFIVSPWPFHSHVLEDFHHLAKIRLLYG